MKIELTPREVQVVQLVGEGLSYKAIGKRLGIARSSVAVYVSRIARLIPGEASPLRKMIRLANRLPPQPE